VDFLPRVKNIPFLYAKKFAAYFPFLPRVLKVDFSNHVNFTALAKVFILYGLFSL
jgi:hypothetical protein